LLRAQADGRLPGSVVINSHQKFHSNAQPLQLQGLPIAGSENGPFREDANGARTAARIPGGRPGFQPRCITTIFVSVISWTA